MTSAMSIETTRPLAAGYALSVGDDELLVGHVLTSVAGWGPELEINIAISSMGQDEIGHARRLYDYALRSTAEAERHAYETPAERLGVSALAKSYPRRWESLLARQLMYELADQARLEILRGCGVEALAALAAEIEHEERYHRDFWRTWLTSTLAQGESAVARVQSEIDSYWPAAGSMFEVEDSVEDELGVAPGTFAAARDQYLRELSGVLEENGLVVPAGNSSPVDDSLAEMLAEMRVVYDTAPGQW
jgi:ring-1,2-phenylacetyl-CoA epoxidase subunit PaaC